MKFGSIFLLIALAAFSAAAVNVRRFGARGDGVADDTAAIQAALNEVQKQETFFGAGAMPEMNLSGHGGHGGYGEVFFPEGVYRISDTLVYDKRKIMLRGEDGSVIEQSAPEKELFYFDRIFRANIRNLTFRGGRQQLLFFTDNNDMTVLDIRDCRFEKSGSFAISVENWTIDGAVTPPYRIAWDNGKPTLTPQDLSRGQWWWNSTQLLVRHCDFADCRAVLEAGCDMTLLADSTVEMGKNAGQAAFKVHNNVNFERVKGYWETPNQPGRVWIAHGLTRGPELGNGGLFSGRNLDFDNAGETGILLLDSTSRSGYVSFSLRLQDSTVKCAGNEFNSILRFEPKAQSSILTVTGVTERSGKPVKAVSYAKPPTADELQNEIRYQPWKDLPANAFFKMKLGGNSPSIDDSLPPALNPFRIPLVPDAVRRAVSVEDIPDDAWPALRDYPYQIKAQIPDTRDAADAIQAALDQARPGSRVVLPGLQLNLKHPLRVPPDIAISAEGMALLILDKTVDAPLMEVSGPGRNLFANLAFAQGSDGVKLAGGDAVAAFENCGFFNQTGWGVVAPEMEAVRIAGSIFYTAGGLDSSARRADVVDNWVCNSPLTDRKAFFVNRGEMLAAFNLFVPILPRTLIGDGRKPDPEHAALTTGNQVRWFDNYGKLHCRNNRFGGEFMGMTPVYQRAAKGSVLIEGGYCWFGNLYTRACQVYCEEIPDRIVLSDLICNTESAKPEAPCNIWRRDPETGIDVTSPVGLPVTVSGLLPYAD